MDKQSAHRPNRLNNGVYLHVSGQVFRSGMVIWSPAATVEKARSLLCYHGEEKVRRIQLTWRNRIARPRRADVNNFPPPPGSGRSDSQDVGQAFPPPTRYPGCLSELARRSLVRHNIRLHSSHGLRAASPPTNQGLCRHWLLPLNQHML